MHDCSFLGDIMLPKPTLKHSHISNMITKEFCHPFNNPEKYTGKNQEILQVFIRSCEHLFTIKLITYYDNQQRNMYTVNNMKSEAKKMWFHMEAASEVDIS